MPKHGAKHQLTDQNWDQEEEPEQAGEFVQASEDVLKERKIKKAIRKTASTDSTGAAVSAFSGFSGFGAMPGASLFSCKPTTNGSSTAAGSSLLSSGLKTFSAATNSAANSASNGLEKRGDNSGYLKQLKALNEGVLSWIKQHVEKNPYCVLTPIFRDYEKHLTEIEKKYPKAQQTGSSSTEIKPVPRDDGVKKIKAAESEEPKKPSAPTGFGLFGASSTAAKPLTTESTVTASPFSAFKFPTSGNSETKSSFSFGLANPGTSNSTAGDQGATRDEEEYVPPKAEVKVVEEEGAVYTKRCKLFYQKDGAWADKGVGNLHLKETDDKIQLVIRADTSLGNILLNILLTKSIPVQRQGKNNVSLMCVPNPPLDDKAEGSNTPVPMLIRVKTGADADELLEKINELKK